MLTDNLGCPYECKMKPLDSNENRSLASQLPRMARRRLELLVRSQSEVFPYRVRVCGVDVIIHRGVFSPKYFESTEIFSERFPYKRGDQLLEMGCGCGITSILAAMRGATRVLAVDISSRAVKSARANAFLHHVEEVVEVRKSDLFSSVPTDAKFSTIYWNPPWVFAREELESFGSVLDRSVVDFGYRSTAGFLAGCSRFLTKHGRVLFGFASFGDVALFLRLAKQTGYRVEVLFRQPSRISSDIQYFLYQLSVADPMRAPGR